MVVVVRESLFYAPHMHAESRRAGRMYENRLRKGSVEVCICAEAMVGDRDGEIDASCFDVFLGSFSIYPDFLPIPLQRPCRCIWFFYWGLRGGFCTVPALGLNGRLQFPIGNLVWPSFYTLYSVCHMVQLPFRCWHSSQSLAAGHFQKRPCPSYQNARKCHQGVSWFSPLMTGED